MATKRRGWVLVGFLAVVLLFAFTIAMALAGLLGTRALEIVSQSWGDANAMADRWYAWVDKFGKLAGFFVTIGSGAYAIHQKFHFAEFNMHVRLREFQERVEERLKNSSKEVDRAALRPGPSRSFESPIFTDQTLDPVLKRMKWGRRPRADESLEATLLELQKQLNNWDGQKKEYELRKAQACLLKGAIAAARAAKNSGEDARKDNVEALGYFQEAFDLSQKNDPEALEYIGHQQVRLGDHNPAIDSFEGLAAMAPEGPSLLRARARKFQAEVHEFRPQPNYLKANYALINAVTSLPPDAPVLEKAEINEMHGRVREKAGIGLATQSYTEAERFYQRIVDRQNDADVPVARAGLTRVREALQRIRLKPIQPSPNNEASAAGK